MKIELKESDVFELSEKSTNPSKLMVKRPIFRATALTLSIAVMGMISGCTVGPKLYESSFTDYNNAVRKTLDQQMLANLVRMRYYESPIFLQVSSLNSSFSVGGNVGATTSSVSGAGGANTQGGSLGASYSESPTISFSMPESKEYYGRLMAPLSAKQVTSLILGGFDTDLVLRTSVRGINGLKNLQVDHADLAKEPAYHAKFREMLTLLTKLRSKGLIDMELGGKETFWSSPVSMDVKGEMAKVAQLATGIYAMSNDAEIVEYGAGKNGKLVRGGTGLWQAHRYEKNMALRFAPAARKSRDARRLKKLLGLKRNINNFPIVEAEMVNAEKGRGVMGQSPGALDPRVVWTEIGLRGRSMMEIMQVASKEVRISEEEVAQGTVAKNRAQNIVSSTGASDWLVIRSSNSAPKNSTLSVKYRGNWYYIENTDLKSRKTFAMLTALFAVVGGTVPGAHPVLTLPVK